MPPHKPYIPKDVQQILEHLSMMFLKSPTFKDTFFTDRNVEQVFYELNEGLKRSRKKIDVEDYEQLLTLSQRMREHFEADPEDSNGQAREGRKLIREMQIMLLRKV